MRRVCKGGLKPKVIDEFTRQDADVAYSNDDLDANLEKGLNVEGGRAMLDKTRFCDGVDRRDFLRLGTAGLFGMGLSLPSLLQSQAWAATQGKAARPAC